MLALSLVGLMLLGGPAHRASASATPGTGSTGVHDVTIRLRAGANGTDVLISWAQPTAEQQHGLTWSSVYFGSNPQPILVFPPETNVTVPDLSPGTYPVGIELDYGPRSNYTRSRRYRTEVTVPLHLAAADPASNGPPQVAASPAPSRRPSALGGIQDAETGALLGTAGLGAVLLAATGGALAVRRRRRRAP